MEKSPGLVEKGIEEEKEAASLAMLDAARKGITTFARINDFFRNSDNGLENGRREGLSPERK